MNCCNICAVYLFLGTNKDHEVVITLLARQNFFENSLLLYPPETKGNSDIFSVVSSSLDVTCV